MFAFGGGEDGVGIMGGVGLTCGGGENCVVVVVGG